ncbi:MAG: hypothetical protein ACXWBS_02570 [Chthoniobacterales bacterium]
MRNTNKNRDHHDAGGAKIEHSHDLKRNQIRSDEHDDFVESFLDHGQGRVVSCIDLEAIRRTPDRHEFLIRPRAKNARR